jgi:cobalt-zinc-cadmium efflux system protein
MYFIILGENFSQVVMSHVRKPLASAVIVNSAIFIGEAIAGLQANSLSLIMDSVHNLSDEMALLFLFLAYVLPITLSRNLQRVANIFNSFGLIGTSVILIWQAVERIISPVTVIGFIPAIAGILAAVANGSVAYFLKGVRNQNAAIRLAYIHNLGDIYVSLAPVAAGILILFTGKSIFDPLIAMGIALWLIWSTLKEIKSSSNELIWPENAVCKHEPMESYNTTATE